MLYSEDKFEVEKLEENLRKIHHNAPRKEAWRRVAEEAARFFTYKYRPVIDALDELAQEDTTHHE